MYRRYSPKELDVLERNVKKYAENGVIFQSGAADAWSEAFINLIEEIRLLRKEKEWGLK